MLTLLWSLTDLLVILQAMADQGLIPEADPAQGMILPCLVGRTLSSQHNYDGSNEVEIFLTPFQRLAERYGWDEMEKNDRLYECLKGKTMMYVCSLPQEMCNDFRALSGSLINIFGRRDPPTKICRKLSEIKQKEETNEELAEEIKRLVTRAYPTVGLDMQDQLAAEYFLKAIRMGRLPMRL